CAPRSSINCPFHSGASASILATRCDTGRPSVPDSVAGSIVRQSVLLQSRRSLVDPLEKPRATMEILAILVGLFVLLCLGVWFVGLPIFLLVRTGRLRELSSRLDRLEKQLDHLLGHDRVKAPVEAPAPAPAELPRAAIVEQAIPVEPIVLQEA